MIYALFLTKKKFLQQVEQLTDRALDGAAKRIFAGAKRTFL